ncbi:MAG: alpha-glucan family phosphorylase [Synergistaceae bacterium]
MRNIVIHGHFYQPARENPQTGVVLEDITATPFHDWNEKITAECYLPNSSSRIVASDGKIIDTINNYSYMSFNFGPTLHSWLERENKHLSSIISNSKRAIAQAYNHIIMPLATRDDKDTQVKWGVSDFLYRYKRLPLGMWLPETAVDTETLEVLAENNIEFTILSPHQCLSVETNGEFVDVSNKTFDITLPYRCELPSGKSINIIFYDGAMAQNIAFGSLLENGDIFYDEVISHSSDLDDHILLVATDGETYGHHHKFGDMALARLFERLRSDVSVNLVDIATFLREHPPVNRCNIRENTSWSCMHGIERWRSDCGCSTGGEDGWNQRWRGPLRDSLDNLRVQADKIYNNVVSPFADPKELRNKYISLVLDNSKSSYKKFISKELKSCDENNLNVIFKLLKAQKMRMLMYTSCAWFFNDISGVETKQVISFAIRVAELTKEATGIDILSSFIVSLSNVQGNTTEYLTADIIANEILEENKDFTKDRVPTIEKKARSEKSMSPMNYNSNLAKSLLSTLESDPTFRNIAYFSMEIGLSPEIPTYSGGLGILAGDILKSSADLGVPAIGVTLLYKNGYFNQKINSDGRQSESPVKWNPEKHLTMLPNRVTITINKRDVTVAVWTYTLLGLSGSTLPVYFLDTDLPENSKEDRLITAELYGGDNKYRLCQELVLGIAGLRILRDMGFDNIKTFHLNEGHAGFITLELLREQGYGNIEKIKNQVIFTTHTPVAAGHDFFSYELIDEVIDNNFAKILKGAIGGTGLSMTDLALTFSRYVNGVSKKHAEVSREMFVSSDVDWITNGVHSKTWTSPSFAKVYDDYIPGWQNAPERLMQAFQIPADTIWRAHQASKMKLLALVLEETGEELSPDVLTIGFARRAATYKRAGLIFSDIERLVRIATDKVQFIFSGKAHPHDEPGKDIIQRIYKVAQEINKEVKVVFLENYNMSSAKLLVAGTDVWLNTPVRPREASGTSGMKCVHNGVINFSVLDGWWIEGCIDGVTGWSIGAKPDEKDRSGYNEVDDINDMYYKLENIIIPTYYDNRGKWLEIMKATIAINASYFNTHRVVKEYCEKAYGTVFRGH